jgi:ribonuclease P protein component
MNEAVKIISLNFSYSYLVIAKVTMLDNEYTKIKESLISDFKRIK